MPGTVLRPSYTKPTAKKDEDTALSLLRELIELLRPVFEGVRAVKGSVVVTELPPIDGGTF